MDRLSKKQYKILVVDDEPTVSASIDMILKHRGHKVWAVDNGEAAIALCKVEQFDLIITDYYMPDMKGDELSAMIRRDWPAQKILMISAYADKSGALNRCTDGVDGILTKPFSLEALIMAIEEIIG